MAALRKPLLAGLCLSIVLGACGAAAAPSPPSSVEASPPPGATVPGGAGGGVGSGGDPGTGGGFPGIGDLFPPPPDEPGLVVPKPGRLNVHPVGVTTLEVAVRDRHAWARVSWWSGVEPCAVLDSVLVERVGTTVTITVREGADALEVACIEIARLKATIVDLGELEPGSYTVSAFGEAPEVTLDVK